MNAMTSPPRSTFVSDVTERLKLLTDCAALQSQRLATVADAAYGGRPECAASDACAPLHAGGFGGVLAAIDRLRSEIDGVSEQVDRLADIA